MVMVVLGVGRPWYAGGMVGHSEGDGGGSGGPGSWSRLAVQVQRDGDQRAEGRRRAREKMEW